MRNKTFDFEWLGYGLVLTCSDGDERFLQGDDGSELLDQLEEAPLTGVYTQQDLIAEYFVQ